MAAAGHDLHGEARFVDAMVPRGSRILDAGSGPGRVGGRLAQLGHQVVGVDIDPELIEAATAEHPDATWLAADLAQLDLAGAGLLAEFDAIVCAGNVMTFLDPATRGDVLRGFATHLATDGRVAIGFGAGRGYSVEEYLDDVAAVGLREHLRLATWDLRPFDGSSDFLVSVLGH